MMPFCFFQPHSKTSTLPVRVSIISGMQSPLSDAMVALEANQREAVLADPTKPLLISAGAGSGCSLSSPNLPLDVIHMSLSLTRVFLCSKTRVLTMRIAMLLERHHVLPEQILALTFTNKACREMQDRVGKLCPMIAKHALSVKTSSVTQLFFNPCLHI